MTLPKPDLDDRKFDDLVQEAKVLIPRYTPDWTDHNWSDPGITFVDLFSWLTELSLYRINQITDRHRLKYLKMLGTSPRPAEPARVELSLDSEDTQFLPGGTAVSAICPDSTIPFELDEAITIVPVSLKKVIADEGSSGVFDRTAANEKGDQFFTPFGMSDQNDCVLYLGFETARPPDSLSFYIFLYEQGMIPSGTHGDEPAYAIRDTRLIWEYKSIHQKWEEIPADSDTAGYADATNGFRKSGRITIRGLAGWQRSPIPLYSASDGNLYWLRCRVRESHYEFPPRIEAILPNTVVAMQRRVVRYEEDTRKRTGNGLPDQVFGMKHQPILDRSLRVAVIDAFDERFSWDDLPLDQTPVDTPFANERKKLCQFLHREFSIDWISRDDIGTESLNANEIKFSFFGSYALLSKNEDEHWVHCSLEDGRSKLLVWHSADRSFSDSFWREVDDFDGSGPDDRHFIVEYTTGEVRFGDGRFGKVPEPGSDIRIIRYTIGGGEAGTIVAGLTWKIDTIPGTQPGQLPSIGIRNLFPAYGGSDRESIDEAFSRVQRDLKIPFTAVTSEDFEEIACSTPGLRIAKARAFTTASSDRKKPKAAVTVVVVPYTPFQTFVYPPVPSDEFLNAVCRHIDRHRLLGTNVRVVAPEYVRVSVEVTIVPDEGYQDETVKSAVKNRLLQFLHPITGGPEQSGWPLGRMVTRSELYGLLDETAGVRCAIDLSISGDARSSLVNGNLHIGDTATVYPGTMAVTVTRKASLCTKTGRTYE